NAKLLDFGIARHTQAPSLTKTGPLVGTPGYMAPEQVRAERALAPSADVFALGCVLFECLTAKPAFHGNATEAVFARILLETPPLLRAMRPDVPLALEGLVEQMLDKDEAMRPSADQVARELAALQSALQTAAETSSPSHPTLELAFGSVIGGKY